MYDGSVHNQASQTAYMLCKQSHLGYQQIWKLKIKYLFMPNLNNQILFSEKCVIAANGGAGDGAQYAIRQSNTHIHTQTYACVGK